MEKVGTKVRKDKTICKWNPGLIAELSVYPDLVMHELKSVKMKHWRKDEIKDDLQVSLYVGKSQNWYSK